MQTFDIVRIVLAVNYISTQYGALKIYSGEVGNVNQATRACHEAKSSWNCFRRFKVPCHYQQDGCYPAKDCSHPQHHQRHNEEAQVPASPKARLFGVVWIVANEMAAADPELRNSTGGLLVALALEADQLRRDGSAVNGVENLQTRGV